MNYVLLLMFVTSRRDNCSAYRAHAAHIDDKGTKMYCSTWSVRYIWK